MSHVNAALTSRVRRPTARSSGRTKGEADGTRALVAALVLVRSRRPT